MHKGRLEAFSDGVVAIITTIMVLEFKVPHGSQLADLAPLLPLFLGYALSFIFVGIYWNNHHHMMQAVHGVNAAAMWANLHLLFWLSVIPFVTNWMGEHHREAVPVALYVAAIPLAFVHTAISQLLFVVVAILWLAPDRRIERVLADERAARDGAR